MNSVVYRATITLQNSKTAADDVVNEIYQWVQSEPSIVVNGITLDIDPSCPTLLESLDADDCFINDTVSNQQEETTSSMSAVVIIGMILGLLVALFIFLVIVVSILYYCHKTQPKRYSLYVCPLTIVQHV